MNRKRIAIFFVLFATILLLVHAVVPHHHHKSQVCLATHHCQSDCTEDHHESPINDHRHGGESDSEFCVLKQAVFIPSNQGNQFDKCLFNTDKPLSFLGFQALVFDNRWKSYRPVIVFKAQATFTDFSYSNFVASSPSLRAPPVV